MPSLQVGTCDADGRERDFTGRVHAEAPVERLVEFLLA